jgi:protein involved in ribonucleotide reduction
MTSSQNKRKELEHILSKENFVKITGSIKMLREGSPFRGAIELLVAYYNKSDNSSVKRLIREFLNDLKDQSSCEEVIAGFILLAVET